MAPLHNPCFSGPPPESFSWFLSYHKGCRLAETTHANGTTTARVLFHDERFADVSSFYAPGTVVCWACVVASVFVSWFLHPRHARDGAVTNDLLGALTVPLVAAGHVVFVLALGGGRGEAIDVTGWTEAAMRATAALEAPVLVSEDFLPVGLLLFAVAVRRRHRTRAACVLLVLALCTAAQLALAFKYHDKHPMYMNFARLFLFEFVPGILLVAALPVAIVSAALFEAVGPHRWARHSTAASRLRRQRLLDLVARLSQVTAVLVFVTQMYLKYGIWSIYASVGNARDLPPGVRTGQDDEGTNVLHFLDGLHNRFIPKSTQRFVDLDQLVTTAGGLITLGLSLNTALKHRRRQQQEKGRSLPMQELTRRAAD